MKNTIETGMNRTGIDLSPIDKKLAIEGAAASVPSMDGDASTLDEARIDYLEADEPIGTMPPPASVKGAAGAVVQVAKGASPTVFLDKLGERLAFERTGTRLYETLIAKLDVSEPIPGGPERADLEKIHAEELEHFEMLREAMLSLGADPTAITPSADVAAVTSLGLIQVIGDPRMNLKQSLEAILVAELVDNDCWPILTELAVLAGQDELAQSFRRAIEQEAEHLIKVRQWVMAGTFGESRKGRAVVRETITGEPH